MAALLRVPVMGSAHEKIAQAKSNDLVQFPIRVRRAWWESNDHQKADTLKLTAEWRDIGTDPRLLTSAIVEFYLGNANDYGDWTPSRDNLRFVGVLQRAQRTAREGEGFSVELEFVDYTTFFLKAKLPQDGVPDYSQTLDDAWKRICDHTGYYDPDSPKKVISSVAQLRGRLEPLGALAKKWPPTLGRASSSRFSRLAAKIPVKPEADAWAVWQQAVGMCGLISFIRKDTCCVVEAQDYYTDKNAPRLIWGRNILSMQESRNAELAGKGVAITSYDPITMTTLEAFYPPRGDERSKQKRAATDKGIPSEKHEFLPYTGITDQKTLEALAYRVWEERSRQELEGQLTTAEMFTDTVTAESFDLLNLGSGDAIRVEFAEREKHELIGMPSEHERVAYLVERGYSEGVATLMAKNVANFARLKPEFVVRRVTVDFQTEGTDGSFEIQINYANRIQILGDASAKEGWI
jgi:hypothetical protein